MFSGSCKNNNNNNDNDNDNDTDYNTSATLCVVTYNIWKKQ